MTEHSVYATHIALIVTAKRDNLFFFSTFLRHGHFLSNMSSEKRFHVYVYQYGSYINLTRENLHQPGDLDSIIKESPLHKYIFSKVRCKYFLANLKIL